jgi:peptide subunit release factor 1 (eRF1)
MARARGFQHRCPLCGAEDGLAVKLADTNNLACGECNEELTTEDVRGVIEQWAKMLAWLESAPTRKD